jgi:hypothetical protein
MSAEQYRCKAEECRARAEQSTNPIDKTAWLNMAEQWENIAQASKLRRSSLKW